MNPYALRIPSSIVAGCGSFDNIAEHLKPIAGVKSVFIVSQPSMRRQGFLPFLQKELGKLGIAAEASLAIQPEPTEANIEEVFRQMGDRRFDLIIGLGGGSALDAAKLLSVLATNSLALKEMVGVGKVKEKGIPTVLIPSTSGTGSEVTPNAIVTFPDEQLKAGVVSPYLLPRLVILDPALTVRLPKPITAATGMDAFTHALESYISVKANPFSDMFALEAIRLISRGILRAYRDGDDLLAREQMLIGSMYGGLALSGAGTAAVHAMAYPIGGRFGVTHGVANSMLLPHIMAFNLDAVHDRLAQVADAIGLRPAGGSAAAAEAVLRQIEEWTRELNIPQNLAAFGVREEHLNELSVAASKVTRLMDNNPKPMGLSDIKEIYGKLLR